MQVEETAAIDIEQRCAADTIPERTEDVFIPDAGYGWVCVARIATVNAFTWGVSVSYGVFLAYYLANNVLVDASALDYAFIGGLMFGAAIQSSSPATIAVRLWGFHAPILEGIVFHNGGFIAASFATRIWQLYLSQGLLVGMGVGWICLQSYPVASQFFDKQRSLANGIMSTGVGLGGAVFSFAVRAIINDISLAWALRIIGIVSGVCNLIACVLLRSRNKIIKSTLKA